MKVAVPIEKGNDLDARIDATLKTCAEALIIETYDDQVGPIHVVTVPSPGDSDSLVDALLAEGVDVAVFGYVPPWNYAKLKSAGVKVYMLAEGSARYALSSILARRIHDPDQG